MEKKYYVENQNGNLVEVEKHVAYTHPTYGVKQRENGHTYESHSDCDDISCYVCNLAICIVCMGGEASLTKDCCGRRLTPEEQDEVQDGLIDFENGKWVKTED